ncbi:MAG: pyruvate kinase, partial [Candidatus Omnitrophota bacterium]
LVKGECFDVHRNQLNYSEFYRYLKPGDIVLAHDSIYRLEVEKVTEEAIRFLSHSDGLLMNLKGLHIKGACNDLPFLFSKDLDLIKEACDCRLDYLALSFVRNANDIRTAKEILDKYQGSSPRLITKVETHAAVENLDDILSQTDSILIDRGDLSSEVGIHDLAHYQEKIIQNAKKEGKSVYLATQFLKNMEKNPLPLIAETLDLHKTLKTGINGIQLSEETAVGIYPVQCVEYVFKAFNRIFNER